ncbi:hypothetical protein CMO88_04545 [Candidatus Woesearchaeota archaeon]|nr:hypothetical protein [Candidatus Woesearchaeota archaeon]|tara:strand:- start:6324 stop:6722 length:399 start_codon:yes stop_codon:yes gene_type:complete
MKTYLIALAVMIVFVVSSCSSQQQVDTEDSEDSSEFDSFASCIKENGLKMYGSFTCSVCKRQRAIFGSSFELVGEIECHPRGENPQTELCLQKDIEKTPTWILEQDGEEIKRLTGFQNMETLAEISGCQLPP